jgi:excisionase family DNA binding protein
MLCAEACMSLSLTDGINGFVPQLGRSVSIAQAAVLLGVSRRTVYNHIKSGRLSTLRTAGGSQRVLVASLHQQPSAGAAAAWPQRPATL